MKKIAIHSVPRSGSTWLGTIVDSHPQVVYKFQPLFSYALKGFLKHDSSKAVIDNFFDHLLFTEDDFMNQTVAKLKGIVPNFVKTDPQAVVYKEVRYHHILKNMLEQTADVKVAGLVRNPMATLYSWWRAPKEFRAEQGWKIEDEWLSAPSKNLSKEEEFNGYLKWKEVAMLFQKLTNQFPEQFYLMRYKDLLNNTKHEVSCMFDFCGLEFSEQTESFLQLSKAKQTHDAYSVYKAKGVRDDEWKDKLPKDIVRFIEIDLRGTTLEYYLE